MKVSCAFDSGAIEVVAVDAALGELQLRIRADNAAEFAQWFHFRVDALVDRPLTLRFLNAGQCAYPGGWDGYRIAASYDRQHWFRIETHYDGQEMRATLKPRHNSVSFAYFEPYPHERHLDLLGRVQSRPGVSLRTLGQTLDGRDMQLLQLGVGDAQTQAPKVWVIARQHPGETMAEWFVEGMLHRLLDPADALARSLLQHCRWFVVPNMNPDGAVRGNLRTNAAGANLNREWLEPSQERSPEVWLVRQAMLREGVDLCLDVHGDEVLPYNFCVGSQGTQGFHDGRAKLEEEFKCAWQQSYPDFQTRHGYPPVAPGEANPTLATNWVAQQFDCLALTIEMPFKDNADAPDATHGWSGARAQALGASVLLPVWQTVNPMRLGEG